MGRQELRMRARREAKRRAGRGFTLVELLSTLAIIAVLFALLAPVIAQTRRKIRASACLSNLRQIGMATTLYTQDYDERYAGVSMEPYNWLPDVHQAYLKLGRVWICPSDTRAQAWDGRWNSPSFQA